MNDYARSSAFLKAGQIHEQAARLKLLPFPSLNPRLFATFICNLCEKLRARISSPGAGERETTLISLFLVDQVAPTLRFIEGASSENTPASLVVPVEKIGEEVHRDCGFMVRRQFRYNYSERELRGGLEEALEDLLPETEHKALFNDLPPRLFAISFPSFERDNALLHVNFAHEIAHPLEQKYLATEDDQPAILQKLKDELAKGVKADDPVRKLMAVGQAWNPARQMRQAALMEILSDIISARVFGPSALFALYEVATLSRSMDKISPDFHPAWRFRLREIFTTLEELEFIDSKTFRLRWPKEPPNSVSGIREKADDWLIRLHRLVEETPDIAEIENNFPAKQAYDSANTALPQVRKFAEQSVPQPYAPPVFSEEVPGLLERLHLDLPPNRIEHSLKDNREVRLASILASGWLFKLGEVEPVFGQDRDAYVQRVQTLNRLVLKAIQLSEIQAEFAKWKRKQDNGAAKQA